MCEINIQKTIFPFKKQEPEVVWKTFINKRNKAGSYFLLIHS